MNMPRIYSISTVGILKHYNQDYLIHPVRTDFTGGNGIGKSILADLLQLIFIYDYRLIDFGTDGLNKEDRQPYTLPLKVNEAYAFLNVEVSRGAFVTIGVCIPNKRGKQIRPFVVLSNTDLEKGIKELTYPKTMLLTSNDFFKEGNFLSIENLGKHLREKYNLFLQHFAYKEDKDRYYSFLFDKNILPINLSIEDNLKAFSKIIQSFSKARSLDVNNSDSLKNFYLRIVNKNTGRGSKLIKLNLKN